MKKFIDFICQTFARAKQDSPKYWLQIRKFWAWLTVVSAVIVGLNYKELDLLSQVLPTSLANKMAEISKYAAAIGFFAGLQTTLTVKTPLVTKDPEISTK